MKTLKINFVDFWNGYNPVDNYFYHTLKLKYKVEIEKDNPDFIFFSHFGQDHKKYKCKKVFYTGENWNYSSEEFDYSFTFQESSEKNYYLPLWIFYIDWFNTEYNLNRDPAYLIKLDSLLESRKINKHAKNKFCCFICGNPINQLRNYFTTLLSKYKTVDCPGRVLNNCPEIPGKGDHKEKLDFLENYRFNICFENSKNSGYITEKIIHPFYTKTIPIYWGGDRIYEFFNKESFILYKENESFENTINKIIEIDKDEDLFVSMVEQPVFSNINVLEQFNPKVIMEKLDEYIIS
jgi:hypothetical protein